MDNSILKYNINPLVSAIGKTPDQFTKEDIINFITANDIRVVNFRYRRESRRLQPLLLHPGRIERPLRHSPFLHGLPRPLR